MYLAYGMTWDEYWFGDPWMTRAFAQAFLLKRKLENEMAWIQGAYIANAVSISIANTFGKKHIDYLKEPLNLFPKTEAEEKAEIRAERRKLIEFLSRLKRTTKINETGVGQNGKP